MEENQKYLTKFLAIYDYLINQRENTLKCYPYVISLIDNMDLYSTTISDNADLLKTKCFEVVSVPDKFTNKRLGFVCVDNSNEIFLFRSDDGLRYTFEMILDKAYKRVMSLKNNCSAPDISYYYLHTIMKKYRSEDFNTL